MDIFTTIFSMYRVGENTKFDFGKGLKSDNFFRYRM